VSNSNKIYFIHLFSFNKVISESGSFNQKISVMVKKKKKKKKRKKRDVEKKEKKW
jgi:enterochelin esterase-like enzyme